MKFHRINALLIRNLYLHKRSIPRLMDILFWPVWELLLWGFLSLYLEKMNLGSFSVVTVLLGAVIFWDLMNQSQRAVSISFLEEVWERNLLNIFVTPLKIGEFLAASALVALVRIFAVGIIMFILAIVLYHLNFLIFGFYLIPFIINLLIFGWVLGLFTVAIILRFGTSAQVLAWSFVFLIQPFSAVFYPVSVLPKYIQYFSFILPTTHIFEGMRSVVATGTMDSAKLLLAFCINAVYVFLVLWFFVRMFERVRERGSISKLDN
jgi:ABC-2 type transport system permease protein